MIAETGFENIRMRMVAERAGVSTAALHYHFDTRENLFAEALHYSFGHTGADVYEARGTATRATARLARIISASLPLTPSLRREWAMWQELWCRAGRDPESRTLAIDLYRAHTRLDRGDPRGRDRVRRVRLLRHGGARAADQLPVRRLRRAADVPAAPRVTLDVARSGDLVDRDRPARRSTSRSPENGRR